MQTGLAWVAFSLLCAVLICGAATDWKTGKIYNRLTVGAMAAGLVLWTVGGALSSGLVDGLTGSALALAAGLVPMAVLFAAGGIGGGDAKLMGALGAISGDWRCVLAAAVYSFAIAAIMAVVIMIRRRIVGRTLGRIVAAAVLASSRVKPTIPGDSPRVPFGAAIAVGGIVAGVEFLLEFDLPWSAWSPQ
jgi:prepilin peptidase CpaA